MNRVIVIGASAGGVPALIALAKGLPPDLPAAVLVVLHVGAHPSVLPDLMSANAALTARHAEHHEPVRAGQILVAPPDHHLLVIGQRTHLTRGPKEHFSRPAIDPLFRSAALDFGARTVGVVLTGMLDDGTVGLQAIKARGGTAVVQDPDEARERSMPDSALAYVDVDHCVRLADMPALFAQLAAAPRTTPDRDAPAAMRHEQALTLGTDHPMNHLPPIANPSTFACPECHGTLWQVRGAQPERYRCHTGHAYTARSLAYHLAMAGEDAGWNALRALQERMMFLQHEAGQRRASGNAAGAARLDDDARRLAEHIDTLRRMLEDGPSALAA